VNLDASKWEILVHITDVSDIYCPQSIGKIGNKRDKSNEKIYVALQKAAEKRGSSRYDLPLGPLHLMPPIALGALSLSSNKITYSNANAAKTKEVAETSSSKVNRCVTLWLYIDERNGKIIDSGLERTVISSPLSLSFDDATTLLDTKNERKINDKSSDYQKARAILLIAERNIGIWKNARVKRDKLNGSARKREERLRVRELVANQRNKSYKGKNVRRDDGADGSFQRSRGHRIVDEALDIYAYALSGLFYRKNIPVPRVSGSGADRGGRLGTAPLRRYIDGMIQRQALAALCQYGGPVMSREECADVGRKATDAINKLKTLTSVKALSSGQNIGNFNQKDDLRALSRQLSNNFSRNGRGSDFGKGIVKAISSGRENEVVILGNGATAKCAGIKGSLGPGEQVLVKVTHLDAEKGILKVVLADTESKCLFK